MADYTKLSADAIVEQLRVLTNRIDERFPNSGLWGISKQTHQIALKMKLKQRLFTKTNYWMRGTSYFLIALIFVGIAFMLYKIKLPGHEIKLFEFFQVVEAGINDIIFIGIAVYSLYTLESKMQRKKVLKAMEELRSLIHVVDMHQLSKDPQLLIHTGSATESSPKRTYTAFEMGRYFDYSSELLALIAKIAAYYMQDMEDEVILDTANEIEMISGNISQKIWQKVMIIPKEN